MAEYLIKDTTLVNIAAPIRTLMGLTVGLTPAEMAAKLNIVHDSVDDVLAMFTEHGVDVPSGTGTDKIAALIAAAQVGFSCEVKTYNVVVNTSEGAIVTITKGDTSFSQTAGSTGAVNFALKSTGIWSITASKDGKTISETVSVTSDVENYSVDLYLDILSLNDTSWEKISEISSAGTGRNYWAVGDCKSVYLSGMTGTISLNTTLWVYILGFNHNADKEGYGIQFGGFKTADGASGKNICLTDGYYLNYISNGSKVFTINHWGASNYGGWGGSDMRYDILGGTDVAPNGYGAAKSATSIGYSATTNCAVSPVANTLMSCFPADLKAVMKPMTKYTNNVGGAGNTSEKVTALVDYLTLPAEYEVFGANNAANGAEMNYQMQYEYYAAGNDKVKFKHTDTNSSAYWWMRSAFSEEATSFCAVSSDGRSTGGGANVVCGITPVFMV